MHRKDSDGYRLIRATFPYLVFITVFVFAMAGVMWWAHGALPPSTSSGAQNDSSPDTLPAPVEGPGAVDLVTAIRSNEPGAALQAIRIAAGLGAEAVEALGPLMLEGEPRTARLARIALDKAVYGARDPVPVANALFGLLAKCMEMPGLDDAARRTLSGQVLTWIAAVATEAHVPALTALFSDPVLGDSALAVVGSLPGRNALDALLSVVSGDYPVALRVAAAQRLGEHGESSIIHPLILASGGKPGPMGWSCLAALARQGVSPERVFALPPTATAEESRRYAHAVLVAAAKMAEQGRQSIAERLLLGLLRQDAPPSIHRAALVGLSSLEQPDFLPVALGYINTPPVRAAVIDALARANTPDLGEHLRAAYRHSDPAMRAGLLEVMSRRHEPALAELLEEARHAEDVELRVTAARLAGETPAEEDLYALGARGNPWVQRKAFSEYVDLARMRLQQGDADGAAAQFGRVLEGPFSQDHLLEALQGLARAGRAEDRPLIEARLHDPALGDAAWVLLTEALVAEADRDRGRAELTRILPKADNDARRALVMKSLETLGATAEEVALEHGYATQWRVLGPLANRDGSAFGKPYYPAGRSQVGPIIVNGKRLDWEYAEAEGLPALLDLANLWGEDQAIACYAHTEILQAEEAPLSVRIITDGPVECWLNGVTLLSRRAPPGEDDAAIRVDAVLQRGGNRVLIKTLRNGTAWNCAVQITHRDGAPVRISHPKSY